MKKIILIFCIIVLTPIFSFADELANVRAFFDSYVNAANSYSKNVPNYYLDNAKIIRVVLKKDGTKQAANFTMNQYREQLVKSSMLAKVVGYKNYYKNINVTKTGNDYKVSAMRYPNKDTRGFSCYFIVTRVPSGYKFKVESLDTPIQDFLRHSN